jgi:vacuolar-type H+-ATPase catalytic subunit A/Vma1
MFYCVAKESLSEDQLVIIIVDRLIQQDFFQHKAFTEHDNDCSYPITKTIGRMGVIITFYAL